MQDQHFATKKQLGKQTQCVCRGRKLSVSRNIYENSTSMRKELLLFCSTSATGISKANNSFKAAFDTIQRRNGKIKLRSRTHEPACQQAEVRSASQKKKTEARSAQANTTTLFARVAMWRLRAIHTSQAQTNPTRRKQPTSKSHGPRELPECKGRKRRVSRAAPMRTLAPAGLERSPLRRLQPPPTAPQTGGRGRERDTAADTQTLPFHISPSTEAPHALTAMAATPSDHNTAPPSSSRVAMLLNPSWLWRC